MGFLHHLFKPKPSEEKSGGEKREDGDRLAEPADPGAFLQPKEHLPRTGGNHAPLRSSLSSGRKTGNGERREIVITLGDVLARIPTQLLQAGLIDDRRELRFSIDDLSADIARGRAAVPLSKIAALCPGVFSRDITPADDIEIRLPLQKLVEQIGLLRERPARPVANSTAGNALPQETAPEADGEQIQLRLTAILPGCPPEIFVGPLPPIADGVRIALPYALIESQLGQERIEVSALCFVDALPRSLQPFFVPRDGVQVPLPIEEILPNLPGPPPPAPPVTIAPSNAGSLEAADVQVDLAEFLAQAEDQSLAPAPVGEPHSESASEPPFALPDPAEVAAQTPVTDIDVMVSPPGAQVPAPEPRVVLPEAPTPPVFAPPPVSLAPLEVVAESTTPPVKELVTIEPVAAMPAPIPLVPPAPHFVHPPPPLRPVLVQPPPIFATALSPAEPAPVAPPEPPAELPATIAPADAAEEATAIYDALQSLFMTDEALDLAAVCRHAAALPGVQGCAIALHEAQVFAGNMPKSFDLAALRIAAQQFEKAAEGVARVAGFGGWQNLALHGDGLALSLFTRANLLLAVLHRPFPPGVRERLSTVATELARS